MDNDRTSPRRSTGGSAARTTASDIDSTLFTRLGLRRGFQVTETLRATATAGWRHVFGDVDSEATSSLAGSTPFSIAGAPFARDDWISAPGSR